MTVALCTNCGTLKYGAFCPCPACKSEGPDWDINILLSDHNLLEAELSKIGNAIRVIHDTGLDEEMRFRLLLYFLSSKWPKLLEYDIDAVEPELQKKVDALYRSRLSNLEGQDDPTLRVSPIQERRWTAACGPAFQADDDAWQREVRDILLNGVRLARQIVALKIQAGEGAPLQRLAHKIGTIIHGCDYRRLAARATELIGDAKEYRRTGTDFCSRVKNGWSDRTQQQAACLLGTAQRLEDMAQRLNAIIEHKAGIHPLIALDLARARQEFRQSHKTFISFTLAVLHPSRMKPDGTCQSR